MKYADLRKKLLPLRVFSLEDVRLIDPDFRQPTLYDWEDQGKVIRIRNKWYVFGDMELEEEDLYLIGNRIYTPSYVSLERALNYHGIIPEAVQEISSVTTQKTQEFKTHFGRFKYRTIKKELFFGYEVIEYGKIGLVIASLEKALLDTLYLNPSITAIDDFSELRYNKIVLQDTLDTDKLTQYLAIYKNKRLEHTIAILLHYSKS